jgi:hypothetical protein
VRSGRRAVGGCGETAAAGREARSGGIKCRDDGGGIGGGMEWRKCRRSHAN